MLPVKKIIKDSQFYLLTEEEAKNIRSKETIAVYTAAFIGVMGVVLLYAPQYAYPNFFNNTPVVFFRREFLVPVTLIIYTLVLVIIQILLLTLLNTWCAHEIAVPTGFLNYQLKKHKEIL